MRALGWVARLLHGLLLILLAIGLAGFALALVLAWRLSQGPLPIDWAARRIEAAANADFAGQSSLRVGHAALRWAGFARGPGRGLHLILEDAALADASGRVVAKVTRADLGISAARLAEGEWVPRSLAVDGLEALLLRDGAGDITIDLAGREVGRGEAAPGPTVAETLAELARPARHVAGRPNLQHIEEMRAVQIRSAVLRLQGSGLPGQAELAIAELDLRRLAEGGLSGRASARLGLAGAKADVTLEATLAPGGGTAVRLELAPVNARAQQDSAPALASEDTLDAAVHGTATLELDPALNPLRGSLLLEAATGQLQLAGTAIGFDEASLAAQAEWDARGWHLPGRLTVTKARVVVRAPGGAWPTTLTASCALSIHDGKMAGQVEAALDHLAFADIGPLWPPRLGGHLRPWLVPNITAGTARDGAVKLSFEAPLDLSSAVLTAIDGHMRGEDLTVWWIKPVPPVEQATATLTINNPQTLDIVIPAAKQGPIALRDGLVHITGLQDKDQFMNLGASVQGSVPDLLTLLRNPRLQLLSRKPIPMRNPAGQANGRLNVFMMLKDKVAFEDVHIQASTHLSNLRLGGLVAGRDLTAGDIQLEATSEALKAGGPATVAGIAGDIGVEMDFKPGGAAQVMQRAQFTGRATGAQLAGAGLDPGPIMAGGTGLFTAKYEQRRDGTASVQTTADLRDAGLALAGWKKPPGQPAEAAAVLQLRGERMLGVDQLHATGPGMAVEGRVEMVGPQPLQFVLDRIVLGNTQAKGTVLLPASANGPVRATLSGAVLDLAEAMSSKPETPAKRGTPFVADVAFDRVLLAEGRGLDGVVAHAEDDGLRLSALTVRSTGAAKVQATIRPEGRGRHLVLHAEDGGALLRAADLYDSIDGGTMAVDATYDDTKQGSPLAGTLDLKGFSLRRAPALGKLLQAATIYGVVDALRGPGLSFSRLMMPFKWDGKVLEMDGAQAFSNSLGLTARGRIDTERKTIAMQGTVVPAYVLNSLLGRIPVLGRLFRSESGGGLVALDYSLSGALGDPAVRVNPLSALTPGFLRGLFHILD